MDKKRITSYLAEMFYNNQNQPEAHKITFGYKFGYDNIITKNIADVYSLTFDTALDPRGESYALKRLFVRDATKISDNNKENYFNKFEILMKKYFLTIKELDAHLSEVSNKFYEWKKENSDRVVQKLVLINYLGVEDTFDYPNNFPLHNELELYKSIRIVHEKHVENKNENKDRKETVIYFDGFS